MYYIMQAKSVFPKKASLKDIILWMYKDSPTDFTIHVCTKYSSGGSENMIFVVGHDSLRNNSEIEEYTIDTGIKYGGKGTLEFENSAIISRGEFFNMSCPILSDLFDRRLPVYVLK